MTGRLATMIHAAPERVVATTAGGLTRRRLLGNLGSVGFGAAVATASIGRQPELAYANHYPDQNAGACGPSPVCACWRCNNGTGAQCDGAETGVGYAFYTHGQTYCVSPSGLTNCWSESGYYCCDCCAHNPSIKFDRCTGCGDSTWYKCICENQAC